MKTKATQGGVDPQRLHRLLRKMIDIYSPSGKEKELLDYLHDYLKRHDLPVQRQRLADGRYNLIVMPPEQNIQLALMGHVDTVSAYDLENMHFSEKDDRIHGLGAADMKSGCAAMIEAYVSLWQSGKQQLPAALVLVVGEEEEGDGTLRLLEEYHFPWALLAEPTQLIPCLSHFGYIEAQLVTRGQRRHASLANQRTNPVEHMLHLLLAVIHQMSDPRAQSICNIRDLLSSQAGFVVPDWCEAWLDIHLPPDIQAGDICAELEALVQEQVRSPQHAEAQIRFHTIHGGYRLPEKGPHVRVLKQVYREHGLPWQPSAFQSHSDANLLWIGGVKPILLGPGTLAKAHAPDESVQWREVLAASRLFRDIILGMFI